MHFTGWTRLNRLANGVTVWEKPDVTPLPVITPRRQMSAVHTVMWGTLPPTVLALAAIIFLVGGLRRNLGRIPDDYRPATARNDAVTGLESRMRNAALFSVVSVVVIGVGAAWWVFQKSTASNTAPEIIEAYFDDLDFRRFEDAYDHIDPERRPDFEEAMFNWRWRGGLLASYGKLLEVRAVRVSGQQHIANWEVQLDWLTSLDLKSETIQITTVKRQGQWYIAPSALRPVQAPARLQRGNEVTWNVLGRRQPRHETDLHRDQLDRPSVAIHGARLVRHNGRFSLVGALTNADADPAMTNLFGNLYADQTNLVRSAAGQVIEQRLLPAETSGFRVDFQGVLSLEDDASVFDPTMYIPPEFANEPSRAQMDARALVVGTDLYRSVALNNVRIAPSKNGPVISGLAVNTGTKTATIVRIIALLYDEAGQPIWADAGYVETNLYPGQSAPFSLALPARDSITIVNAIDSASVAVNGSAQQTQGNRLNK